MLPHPPRLSSRGACMNNEEKVHYAKVGRKLRKARERLRISQQMAADAISSPRTAVTQLENGNRKISALEVTQLAQLYNSRPAYFLTDDPEEERFESFRDEVCKKIEELSIWDAIRKLDLRLKEVETATQTKDGERA